VERREIRHNGPNNAVDRVAEKRAPQRRAREKGGIKHEEQTHSCGNLSVCARRILVQKDPGPRNSKADR
jgi:hypothetical protein